MNIEELFAGIGVVIDDRVFSKDENDDKIVTIVKQLEEENHFPLVKYATFPSSEKLQKLNNVSFLLLDWEIDNRENILGDDGMMVSMPDSLKQNNKEEVVKIVQIFLQNNLAPIFIFSNQDINIIKKDLRSAGIDITKCSVFVESKASLDGDGKLFKKIEEWVNSVSGVYVAKAWENALNKAKNQFFVEMATNSSHWPKALHKAAIADSTDFGAVLTQTLAQNIISRMLPIDIRDEQMDKDSNTIERREVRAIIKGQFFMEPASEASIVGDFYIIKDSGHKKKYYMNIRPTCDCVNREGNDGDIHLLECTPITSKQEIELFENGHFKETIGCAIIGPLYGNKVYRINFKTIRIEPYLSQKENKKGRILSPAINHVTERYSLYVQRQALPRLPQEILQEVSSENADERSGV